MALISTVCCVYIYTARCWNQSKAPTLKVYSAYKTSAQHKEIGSVTANANVLLSLPKLHTNQEAQ